MNPKDAPRMTFVPADGTARELLIALYMDYFNNYLSAEKFGEDNGLTYPQAAALLTLGRNVVNSEHPER